MFEETINQFSEISLKKKKILENNIFVFMLLCMLTGIYLAFANLFVYTLAGPFYIVESPVVKMIIGSTFSVAIILILFTGTDLFTSSTMYISIGYLNKKIKFEDYIKILLVTYIGNFIGSLLLSYVLKYTGLLDVESTSSIILKYAQAKTNLESLQIFLRGILCNMVVCLAIFMCYRTNSDTAKILILFYTILTFVASGFEHSIANMSLFAMSYFIDETKISLNLIINNLIFSTLGNIVGGSLFIGGVYYYINEQTNKILKK